MKTILATLVTIVVGLVALPDTAEARSYGSSSYTYRSGQTSCGCVTYTKRVFGGYDCYHRPIYRYYSVPIVHRCHKNRSHYRSSYYKKGHRGGSYYHSNRHYGDRRYGSRVSYRSRYGHVSICR